MIGSTLKSMHPYYAAQRRRDSPALRLFCFPYAGGNSYCFNKWRSALPAGIEVYPVEIPGRGLRSKEPLRTNLEELVDIVCQEVVCRTDVPFGFFGHSMGALIGFEIARRLRCQKHHAPACLCVSGHRAPQTPPERWHLHETTDELFLEELRRLHGTPTEVLESRELMELFLPILRADFAVCETYSYVPEPPLACPIIAFVGTDDADVTLAHVEAWREQTVSDFRLYRIPGDHFFLHTAERQVLYLLSSELQRLEYTNP